MLKTSDQSPTATTEPSEVEWQLDADDLDAIERWLAALEPQAGLSVRPAARQQIVDHYVDTTDLKLYAAGFAARLRGVNGEAEATLKSVGSEGDPDSGLRRRLELNEPIRYALLHSLAAARGPVGTRIRQHAAIGELGVLFTVRTDRRTAIVTNEEGIELGEIALDDTVIESGDRNAALRRVEVEALIPGAEQPLAPFVESLREAHGLRPGTASKFGSGLELAIEAGVVAGDAASPSRGNALPPTSDPPQPEASQPPVESTVIGPATPSPLPDGSLALLVRDVLSSQLALIRAHEAGTFLGEDIEALHDMRVAVRRLRTALRLFARALPSSPDPSAGEGLVASLDASLRWLAAELGVVRDLDVQLERIDEWQEALDPEDAVALNALADLLRRRREVARGAMVAALDSPRLDELYASLEALAAVGVDDLPRRALRAATAGLPRILERRYRAFRSRVRRIDRDPEPSAALFHEARIRAKRLRYAAEFATPIYGKPARALVSSLKQAQDVLGLHEDAEVAIAELRALALDAGDGLPPATLFAMGEVAQRYRESQRAQRLAFPEAAQRVRRRWRPLRVVARKRRAD